MFHVDSLIMDIFYILEQFIALFNLQQVKVFKTWSKDREWNISAVKKRSTKKNSLKFCLKYIFIYMPNW